MNDRVSKYSIFFFFISFFLLSGLSNYSSDVGYLGAGIVDGDTSLGTLASDGANNVLVLVNSSLYPSISGELAIFCSDIEIGLLSNVTLYVISDSWSSGQVKEYIRGLYYSSGLRGCIFVGQVPAYYYEHVYSTPNPKYSRFPCDYYYMDLDCEFVDSDSNQTADMMVGNVGSEIWVSRIDASGMVNEVELYKDFFTRNHLARNVGSRGLQRGLLWVDDTWAFFPRNYQIDECFEELYPITNRTVINNSLSTTKNNYLNVDLPSNYEWLWSNIHSNATHHEVEDPGPTANWLSWQELNQTYKKATFYNLYTCKAGNFTVPDCIGEWYIFGNTNGQVSISCARDGGFWYGTHDFFKDLSSGDSIGDAWKQMYERGYKTGNYPNGFREPFPDAANWMANNYYWKNYTEGTNLFGDPTLQNCMKNTSIDISSNVLELSLLHKPSLSISLTDDDGWGLYNASLEVEINYNGSWGSLGSHFTDNFGRIVLDLENYSRIDLTIRVRFLGTPNFCPLTQNFTISWVDIRMLEAFTFASALDQGGEGMLIFIMIGLVASVGVVLFLTIMVRKGKEEEPRFHRKS